MGLGTVNESKGLYLSIAGGFIWNRKADKSDPNYATQDYSRADGTTGTRSGARYADLTGKVVGVRFRTHDEYGDSINVTIDSGGDRYVVSISTNNRYSQDMMKALLKADLSKDIFIKPYDFVGDDKKRAMGISFRQDGEKINLRIDNAPSKEKEWFKTASKKEIRRFFEDLTDWYVAEIEEKVISQMDAELPEIAKKDKPGLGASSETESKPIEGNEEVDETPEDETPTPKETEKPKVSPLKMKRALKAYIGENYEDKSLPTLSKEDLVKWFELCQQGEELPFEEESTSSAEVPASDLDSQLDALIPGSN